MSRNLQLRLLGLAVLALLASSAVSAAGAQAGAFTAGAYPATIKAGTVGGPHELSTVIGLMRCAPSFDGELTEASGELTLTPDYGTTCIIGGEEAHVSNNGCDFRVHAGNTLGGGAVSGVLDIVCPEGSVMDFEVTTNPICHLTIPGQTGLTKLTYTNRKVAEDVDLDFNIEQLTYHVGPNCVGTGTYNTGSYEGTSTMKAEVGEAAVSFSVD